MPRMQAALYRVQGGERRSQLSAQGVRTVLLGMAPSRSALVSLGGGPLPPAHGIGRDFVQGEVQGEATAAVEACHVLNSLAAQGSSPLIPVNSVRQQTRHFVELGQQRARAVARQGDRAGADGAARESGVVQTH